MWRVALAAVLAAQAPAVPPPDQRLMAALVEALKPALPYPAADEHDLPVDGNTTALWIVRWPEPGESRVEIVANPLNLENQQRASKADGEIQRAVMAAQQRAQAQYERAVAEFEKTGRTNPIDGITLGDEGIAGERFDASNHVAITLAAVRPPYRARIDSVSEPAVSTAAFGTIVRVETNVYRERAAGTQPEVQRFHACEAHLMFGAGSPSVSRTGPSSFDLVAAAPLAVVKLQGNETVLEQVFQK